MRCRPINEDEEKRGFLPIVSCDTERKQIKVNYGQGIKKVTKSFAYDMVFGRFATQEDVFKHTVAPMVDEVLQGFSCTAFAYGQTGTGKTHTMEGDLTTSKGHGVIPRAVASVFEQLEASGCDFTVRVSFLELYQESLEDLLDPTTSGGSKVGAAASSKQASKGLRLMDDPKKGVQVLGLEEVLCKDPESTIALLQKGVTNRQTAATLCNKQSSRSHSIFSLKVVMKETNAAGEEEVRAGQLNLVDLAGSECVGRSGAKDERAREAGNINQSLLTLGRCITALTEGGHRHIPYRDSKLTRLLQESLGGRAKTVIIATLSPVASNVDETLSTLEYALKAKSIKNKPELNARATSRTLLKETAGEIESLKHQLQASREKNGVYLPPAEYDQLQAQLQAQKERIAEGEQAIRQREEELEEAVATRSELQGQLDTAVEKLHATEEALVVSRAEAQRLGLELAETKTQLAGAQAVIAEQVQTEDALRGQATLLLQSLDAARADVGGLLAKVGRATEALAGRSQRAQAMTAECMTLLSTAQMGMAGMGQVGAAAAAALKASVRTLVEKEVQEMRQALQRLGGEVDVLVKDGGEAAGRVGREMCARLSKEIVEVLVQESKAQSQAMLQRAQDYRAAAAASSAEVRAAFQEVVGWVDASLKSVHEHAASGKKAIQDMASVQAGGLDAMQKQVEAFCKQTSDTATKQAADRVAFVEQQLGSVQKRSEALVQAMQEQVAALMAEVQQSATAFLADSKSESLAQATRTKTFQKESTASCTSSKTAISGSATRAIAAHMDPLIAGTEANQKALGETHAPQHKAALAKVDQEAAALLMGLEAATAAADTKMQQTLESGAAVIKSIEAETTKVEALLQSKGVGVSQTLDTTGKAGSERLTIQGQAFAQLVHTSLSAPVSAAVASVAATMAQSECVVQTYGGAAGQREAPTNTTPTKREYPMPGALRTTRPHADIMAEVVSGAAAAVTVPPPAVAMAAEGEEEGMVVEAAQPQQEQQEKEEREVVTMAEKRPAEEPMEEMESPKKKQCRSSETAEEAVMEEQEAKAAVPAAKTVEEDDASSAAAAARIIKMSRIPRPVKPLGAQKNN